MSTPLNPASAIDVMAARVSTKFFGLAPESAAPSSAALPESRESTLANHLGGPGGSPVLCRRRRFTAIARNRTPIATLSQSIPVAVSLLGSSAPLKTIKARRLTTTKPPTQPNANAGPDVRAFGDPRMRTTPTIGIGLRATATPASVRSPRA